MTGVAQMSRLFIPSTTFLAQSTSRLLCLEGCCDVTSRVSAIRTRQKVCTAFSLFCISINPVLFRYNCPKIRTTLVCPGHVSTAMFNGVTFPNFPFFQFFCPTIQPVAVVKRIIAALDDQHSQTILLPFYTNFMPYLGILPSPLRDFAQWVWVSLLHTRALIRSVYFRCQVLTMPWRSSPRSPPVVLTRRPSLQVSRRRRCESVIYHVSLVVSSRSDLECY